MSNDLPNYFQHDGHMIPTCWPVTGISLRVREDDRVLDVFPDGTFTGADSAEEALQIIGRVMDPHRAELVY